MQMKSTTTYSELIPCFRNRFARKKYGCRFQWYIPFHVSFKQLPQRNIDPEINIYIYNAMLDKRLECSLICTIFLSSLIEKRKRKRSDSVLTINLKFELDDSRYVDNGRKIGFFIGNDDKSRGLL